MYGAGHSPQANALIVHFSMFIVCFSLSVQKGVVIMRVLFRYQFRLVGGHVTSRRGVYRSCPLM